MIRRPVAASPARPAGDCAGAATTSRTAPALRSRRIARTLRQPVTLHATTPTTRSTKAALMTGIVTDVLGAGDAAAAFPTPAPPADGDGPTQRYVAPQDAV